MSLDETSIPDASLPIDAAPPTTVSTKPLRKGADIDLEAMHRIILRGTSCKELMETFNVSKGTINGICARRGWYVSTRGQPLGEERVTRPRLPKLDADGNPIVKAPRVKTPRIPKPKAERPPRQPRAPKPSKAARSRFPNDYASYRAQSRRLPVEQDYRLPNDIFDADQRIGGLILERVEEYAEQARTLGLRSDRVPGRRAAPRVIRVTPSAPYIGNPINFYDPDRDQAQNICRWPTGDIHDHVSNVGFGMEVCGVAIPHGKSYCPHCEMRLHSRQPGEPKPEYSIKTRAQIIAEECDQVPQIAAA